MSKGDNTPKSEMTTVNHSMASFDSFRTRTEDKQAPNDGTCKNNKFYAPIHIKLPKTME